MIGLNSLLLNLLISKSLGHNFHL